MSFAGDALALLQALDERVSLPRVRALHLPPEPPPGGMRGEFCAVELADGSVGLSYVLLDGAWAALGRQHAAYVQPGQGALDLARGFAGRDALARTVGLAAINALTRWMFDRAGYVPSASADSTGHLSPQPGECVGMVGHFTPLIRRIRASGAGLLIVELRADLVGEADGVRVTLDTAELARCEKVLLTGTLLLNDTLDGVLAHCRHARRLAMVGPSVGCPPDPLLARGVTLLGGTWITDAPAYLDALRQGLPTAEHARKCALGAADYPGWPALLARL